MYQVKKAEKGYITEFDLELFTKNAKETEMRRLFHKMFQRPQVLDRAVSAHGRRGTSPKGRLMGYAILCYIEDITQSSRCVSGGLIDQEPFVSQSNDIPFSHIDVDVIVFPRLRPVSLDGLFRPKSVIPL